MGLFAFFKTKATQPKRNREPKNQIEPEGIEMIRNSPDSYTDGSSVAMDERAFYQPDHYYTYYSYPGTPMARKVVTFEDRKKISYPSSNGLYVAEILLLEYCNLGKYPKPPKGYPGFWWFQYGIRNVGHALQSLKSRGYIRWASKTSRLNSLKIDELKQLLESAGLSSTGRKADLIARIVTEISEESLNIPNYIPKYELTESGKVELENNSYVPYMHKHKHKTIEGDCSGEEFNVWSVNRLFPDGNTGNWCQLVGEIEKKLYGVDIVNSTKEKIRTNNSRKNTSSSHRKEIRNYLKLQQDIITHGIETAGDGFDEEIQGIDYRKIGKDKEALVQFYVSIGKKLDAPALYWETAVLLRKYGMYEEELDVLDAGLKNVARENRHWEELKKRRDKVRILIQKRT